MKLALSTDFGAEHHWQRLVAFAQEWGVQRLVFWGDYTTAGFAPPWLYPHRPDFLTEETRQQARTIRERLIRAAELTAQAGMEFWYCYQVLMLPPTDPLRSVCPGLFNEHREPDMAGDLVYQILREQLAELAEMTPGLGGLETWIMECASIRIAHLQHQTLSMREIIDRIVATVHGCCRERGWQLSLDLHTAGGDRRTLDAIFAAATQYPDILVGADNVIGDFHLHLPFNEHLRRAARTNPIQVHFDLNGEYWGRNFVPTSALRQYAEHIEEARRLGAECVNGRVSTGHDRWSPQDNLLPSRRRFYPLPGPFLPVSEVVETSFSPPHDLTASPGTRTPAGQPLPDNLEICCTDTLGGFNAEFFCRRAQDPRVQPEEVVRDFLQREFGPAGAALTPVFLKLEELLGKLFFMGGNYFVAQSVAQSPWLVGFWGLDVYLTSPPGTLLPTLEIQERVQSGIAAAFSGWPTPVGHRTSGPRALIQEKVEALEEAQSLLAEVRQVSSELQVPDRAFLIRLFEDLVFFARAYRWLLEAEVHYYLLKRGEQPMGLPVRERFLEVQEEVGKVADEWQSRYPPDRYTLGAMLRGWLEIMSQG